MSNILYMQLSYDIIGAAMEVHSTLGSGFLEKVYQKALARELSLRNIKFEQYKLLPVRYKGILAGEYEADFVVEDKIILELKAVSAIHPNHQAQAMHYLTATGLNLALIINFGQSSLRHKRVAKSRNNSR